MVSAAKAMDAYIRISRRAGREGESFQSPDIQREQIATWAKLRGVTIAAEHVDIDQTGKKFQRPGLDAALSRIETGQTGGLVAMNTKRFGRSLLDGLEAIRRIREAEAVFASVQDGLDTSTDTGRLVLNIMLAMGEWELERITEANAVAQSRAIRRGVHFRAPLGYIKGPDGCLVPGPLADAIRAMFRIRAGGGGWTEIADRLNTDHPRDVQWLPSVLPRMVKNRAYVGEAYHGNHRKIDAHPPLVTIDIFEAAQTVRAPISERADAPLLRGLIRCAGCRYVMKGDYGGRRTPVYRCQGRHGVGRCPSPAIVSRHIVDAHVEARFLARYGDIKLFGSEASDAIETTRARVAKLERTLDEFASDDRLRDAFGHERFVSAVERKSTELADAENDLREARQAALGIVAPDQDIWDELPATERRRVLAEGIDCVFLRRTGQAPIADRSLILWRGEAPDDLPGRGVRPVELIPFDW
jgi:site-specific DNA recombinase